MDLQAKEQFRLVFHIGAGKTGTSSIQRSLRQSRKTLRSHGCDYWGLMLEHAPCREYEWQNASFRREFSSLTPEVAADQVLDVLTRSIEHSIAHGINLAVWSHEWFFNKGNYVISALSALQKLGVRIEILAYVRRHDLWARSAYLQWGIKHKTYKGPIKPFSAYVKERPIRFSEALSVWKEAFPETFILRNFDATQEVVQDFVKAARFPAPIPSIRVNETPGTEELLLRAIFNNTIKGEVLPIEFDRHFKLANLEAASDPVDWIKSLLPDDEDLAEIRAKAVHDRHVLNEWLVRAGQPPIEEGAIHSKPLRLDNDKLLRMLFAITARQSVKIRQLQRRLRDQGAAE